MKKLIKSLSTVLLISASIFMAGCNHSKQTDSNKVLFYGTFLEGEPKQYYLNINGKSYGESDSDTLYTDAELTKPVKCLLLDKGYSTEILKNKDIYLYINNNVNDVKKYCYADIELPPVFFPENSNPALIDTVKGTVYLFEGDDNYKYALLDFELSDKFLTELNKKDYKDTHCTILSDSGFCLLIGDEWDINNGYELFDLSDKYTSGTFTLYNDAETYEAFAKMTISDGSTDHEIYLINKN